MEDSDDMKIFLLSVLPKLSGGLRSRGAACLPAGALPAYGIHALHETKDAMPSSPVAQGLRRV
jgi:hypothetical protein